MAESDNVSWRFPQLSAMRTDHAIAGVLITWQGTAGAAPCHELCDWLALRYSASDCTSADGSQDFSLLQWGILADPCLELPLTEFALCPCYLMGASCRHHMTAAFATNTLVQQGEGEGTPQHVFVRRTSGKSKLARCSQDLLGRVTHSTRSRVLSDSFPYGAR